VGPVSEDVASRASFLRLWPMRWAARPIGISSAGVGLQSPVPPRVGRDGNAVERGTEHRHRRSTSSTPLRCS